ncbi:hypothetical protein [Streptomyces sp. LN704]|uniref:hypothetical protein n=1 Tax=unclassified Streptomyces TaxID=2593676 RepID=UPI003719F8B1
MTASVEAASTLLWRRSGRAVHPPAEVRPLRRHERRAAPPHERRLKATGGEGGRFELGESEVRAARQHAGNDRWRLLVVTHALTPHKMGIQMLPNPYGKRGRGRYRE